MCIKMCRMTLALCLALLTSASWAQAPRLDLLNDGVTIIGIVSRADGSPAAAVPVQVAQASANAAAETVLTDTAGVFVLTGKPFSTYQISVAIDGISSSAKVSTGEAPPQPWQWPPIYVTLSLLMLLSLIPARLLRRPDLS